MLIALTLHFPLSALFIMMPLAHAWAHPPIFNPVMEKLVVFQPHVSDYRLIDWSSLLTFHCLLQQIYPDLYLWTTYGICTAIDRIWHAHADYNSDNQTPASSPELCSVLEQSLNFSHTGNTRVLATSLMDPLWVSKALIADGIPAFSPAVDFALSGNREPYIRLSHWPIARSTSKFALASKRLHLLNYD
jgi:hypothetical protein